MRNRAAWFTLIVGAARSRGVEAARMGARRFFFGFAGRARDLSGKCARAAAEALTRAGSERCEECSRMIRPWRRYVRLDFNTRRAHLSCWRRRLLFEELSRAMPSRMAVAPRRGTARMHEDVRAMASELRVAVLRLEQSIYDTDHRTVLCDAQEVLSLARTVSAYLRAGAGGGSGWLYSQAGPRLKQPASRVSSANNQAGDARR